MGLDVLTHPHLQVLGHDRWTGVAGHGRACRPRYSINIAQYWSAWWYTYPSEKWSSSVGTMTFPTEWKNKHVPNHQAVDDYGINVYTCLYYIYIYIYIYMWNCMESCLGMEMDFGFKMCIDSEVISNLNKFECELTYLNLMSIWIEREVKSTLNWN